METQIGIELCTAGMAEKMTINGKCTIVAGTIMVISPMFPMWEINRSNDYQSCILLENIENIMPIFAKHIPAFQQLPSMQPYMQLTHQQQLHFLQSIDRIKEKEQLLINEVHPMRRKLLTTMILLIKQETLSEYVYLFSEQLLLNHSPALPKRQVMTSFILMLNQEYSQHRTVAYYAEKQGLTPRSFADIVKEETGCTPMEWINMVTINHAKLLLRQPNIQVKQVAAKLGFPEQFTFRKYFKTHTGMSPTEYITQSR